MTPTKAPPATTPKKGTNVKTDARSETSGLKALGGLFKKRPSAQLNFADHILASFGELEKAQKEKRALSRDFGDHISEAESALFRLMDIKEHELSHEKGSEGYNQLALNRLTEMSRLLEHVRYVNEVVSRFTDPVVLEQGHRILDRLVRHVGEIANEYAESKH